MNQVGMLKAKGLVELCTMTTIYNVVHCTHMYVKGMCMYVYSMHVECLEHKYMYMYVYIHVHVFVFVFKPTFKVWTIVKNQVSVHAQMEIYAL